MVSQLEIYALEMFMACEEWLNVWADGTLLSFDAAKDSFEYAATTYPYEKFRVVHTPTGRVVIENIQQDRPLNWRQDGF